MFFENSSLKGISGQNMSDPLKWSLTDDSRFLQAAILKDLPDNNHHFLSFEAFKSKFHIETNFDDLLVH